SARVWHWRGHRRLEPKRVLGFILVSRGTDGILAVHLRVAGVAGQHRGGPRTAAFGLGNLLGKGRRTFGRIVCRLGTRPATGVNRSGMAFGSGWTTSRDPYDRRSAASDG